MASASLQELKVNSTSSPLSTVPFESPLPTPGPVSLSTLPDETLDAIFHFLPTDEPLPLLSRRFLPFHLSQHYRSLKLGIPSPQYSTMLKNFHNRYSICRYVLKLEIFISHETTSTGNQKKKSPTVKSQEDVFKLLDRFENLQSFSLAGPVELVDSLLPGLAIFARKPTLRNLCLDSRHFYQTFFDGSEVEIDPFDFLIARRHTRDMFPGGRILVNINKSQVQTSPPSFEVQLFGAQLRNPKLTGVIEPYSLSKLHLVDLPRTFDVNKLLLSIQSRSTLTSLSLHFPNFQSNEQKFEPLLSTFSNLTELSLGGGACLDSEIFYETLSTLPLVKLHLGGPYLFAADLFPLLDVGGPKWIRTLQTLVLDNIEAMVPEDLCDESRWWSSRWILPRWTVDCTEAEVRELERLAKEGGVETEGTTFFGLKIRDTEEWKEEEARLEEEVAKQRGECEAEELARQEEAELQDRHDGICSCDRRAEYCNNYRIQMGWKPLEW